MPAGGSIGFGRVAHVYDETRSWPPEKTKAVIDRLYRELSKSQGVLEIGVGTGRLAVPLQRKGVPVLGVDVSPRMMAEGRRRGLRDTIRADVLHLPLKDKSVDATYSVHVLHLVKDWEAALREIVRVTRGAYYTVASFQEEAGVTNARKSIQEAGGRALRPFMRARGLLGNIARVSRKISSAIMGFSDDSRSPMGIYMRSIREAGHVVGAPGIQEKNLNVIHPATSRYPIGTFLEHHVAADQLEALERQTYSFQWPLREAEHRRGLEMARKRSYQPSVPQRDIVELIRWDIQELHSSLSLGTSIAQ